jgi:hypothetical protein
VKRERAAQPRRAKGVFEANRKHKTNAWNFLGKSTCNIDKLVRNMRDAACTSDEEAVTL